MVNDVEMQDVDQQIHDRGRYSHFKIAIDFGTTFSVVAVLPMTSADEQLHIDPDKIPLIHSYHNAPISGWGVRYDVPTESWYPDTKPLTKRSRRTARGSNSSSTHIVSPSSLAEDTEDEEERMAQEDMNEALAAQQSPQYHWGYDVPSVLNPINTDNDPGNKMTRFKLLLDTRQQTSRVRNQLQPVIERLLKLRRIKDEVDIIADYLTHLFRHVYDQLTTYHSFSRACSVEYILCVPAIWEPKACRVMQTAMQRAIANSELSMLHGGSIDNLFIVSEPEAAALCVLPDSRAILPRDSFIIIDAGGGTVDAVCYTVSNRTPLRLERQDATGGALCGSSFLNERFEELLRKRLSKINIDQCVETLEQIVERAVNEFENHMKRDVNVFDQEGCRRSIRIAGLQHNPPVRTSNGQLHISWKELEKVFQPCLDGVQQIMEEQLQIALTKRLSLRNVILTGGFAASKSLQRKIQISLEQFNKEHNIYPEIGLLQPDIPGAAVAKGAILRALNKEEGPKREMQSSFGFLRRELYDESDSIHREQRSKVVRDPNDRLEYLSNTIKWLVKKGDEVQTLQTFPTTSSHTFALRAPHLLCEEILYVIDKVGEDSYGRNHLKNQGAEEVGRIVVDMSFLRKQKRIEPQGPYPDSGSSRRWYDVEFDLIMRIDDRNLHFEARWPPRTQNGDVLGDVKESGQISIAAAFLPGTK